MNYESNSSWISLKCFRASNSCLMDLGCPLLLGSSDRRLRRRAATDTFFKASLKNSLHYFILYQSFLENYRMRAIEVALFLLCFFFQFLRLFAFLCLRSFSLFYQTSRNRCLVFSFLFTRVGIFHILVAKACFIISSTKNG